jgi:hypothetical protein
LRIRALPGVFPVDNMTPARLRLWWLVLLVVAGCKEMLISQTYVRLDPTYVGRDHSQRTLTLVPFATRKMSVEGAGAFDQAFEGESAYRDWRRSFAGEGGRAASAMSRELYLGNHLGARLERSLAEKWRGVQLVPMATAPPAATGEPSVQARCDMPTLQPPRTSIPSTDLFAGGPPIRDPPLVVAGTFDVRIPSPGASKEHATGKGFVLVLARVAFDHFDRSTTYMSMPSAGGVGSSFPITTPESTDVQFDYAVYDYEAKKMVACGHVHGEVFVESSATVKDWYAAIDVAIDQMKAPF